MSSPDAPAERAGAVLLGLLIVLRVAVSPSIYPWTGAAWNAAALLAVAIALLRSPAGRRAEMEWPLVAGIGIYFFYPLLFTIAWSLLHGSRFPPTQNLRNLAEIGSLLLFFLALYFARARPLAAAAAVVTVACLSAAFALRQRLGGFEATLAVDGISEYARRTLLEARVFGLTFSPDMLAATAAAALPLAATLLYLARRDGRSAGVLLSGIAIGLLVTALGLSRSLGGTLAAGAGMAVWVLTFPPLSRRARRGLVGAGLAAVLAAVVAVIVARGGHLLNFDAYENPLLMRLDNWRTALAVWWEFPLTGAGPGQYGQAMFAHRSLCGNEARHVHNLFLETLAELGPIGLAGLGLIIVSFFRAGHRAFWAPADSGRDPLRLAFFASGCAVLFHGLMDFSWQAPEVAAIFWVALAVVGTKEASPGRRGLSRGQKSAIAAAALLAAGWMAFEAWQTRNRDLALQLAREGRLQDASRLTSAGGMRMDDELFALRAQAAYESGWREGAAHVMRTAIAKNPRNPFYYRDLAMWSQDPAERISLMRQAVERYPNSAPLNAMLARMLIDQGKTGEAETVLRHAVKICRESGDAMTMLGMLYDRQGKTRDAEEWLRKGAEAFPPSDTRVKMLQRFLARRPPPAPSAVPPAP